MNNNKNVLASRLGRADILKFVEVLGSVNKDIDQVLEVLNDDFVQLSRDLRNYYRQLEIVAGSAANVAGQIQNENGEEFFKIAADMVGVIVSFRAEYLKSVGVLKQEINSSFAMWSDISEEIVSRKRNERFLENTDFVNLKRYETQMNESDELIRQAVTYLNILSDSAEKLMTDPDGRFKMMEERLYILEEERTRAIGSTEGIEEKTIHGYNSIENLIVNIQFHDIIRQKLEHIQSANYDTIANLEKLVERINDSVDMETLKYLYAIPMVAKLHVRKLELSNAECKDVVDKINGDLTTILKISSELSVFRLEFYNFLHLSENHVVQQGSECLSELYGYFTEMRSACKTIENMSADVHSLLSELSRISTMVKARKTAPTESDILWIEETCGNLIQKLNKSLSLYVNSVKKRIAKLSNASFDTFYSKFHRFVQPELNGAENETEEKLNLFVAKVTSDIRHFVEQIRSSSVFDSKVVTINSQLIQVHEELASLFHDPKSDLQKQRMEEIRKQYTMDSERIIHDELTEEVAVSVDHVDDDDSVEFF